MTKISSSFSLWMILLFLGSAVAALSSSPSPSEGFTAIVIGGGPAGLSLCLGLSSLDNCRQIHLVERQPTFDARGANFFLAANGIKACEEQSPGIRKDFERRGIVADIVPEYPSILIPWWEMRNALLDRVLKLAKKKDGKVTLHMGKELNNIINDKDNGVTVEFGNDEELVLKGDFLVGADGVHSAVRKQLGLSPGTPLGLESTFRGHVENAHKIKELAPILDRGFVPVSGNFGIDGMLGSVFNYNSKLRGKLAWVVGSREPYVEGQTTPLGILDPSQSKKQDDDKAMEDLALFRALIKHTKNADYHAFQQARVMDFSREQLKKYPKGRWGGTGRITLVGDAAHAFPAADGQGGNQAFEDGVVLTRAVRQKQPTESWESVLARVETERLPRVETIHKDQTERFAVSMNGGVREEWKPEFQKWVFEGV